ncbi:glycoside hydrolase family 5 protein [Gelatoporia subvermispora B]|uniref:Glycoside hydrolase family 5 protein n=1 Tax=Ceriporiopsis subvermispora (strain B) TaxID=914234 RepID=M2R5V0_CERS8|nr:glycoside hydrolase family 5 protein [Gelatoporia subvermispora B]
MPRVPPVSPATGKPTHAHFIHTVERQFVDNAGRTLLLRGVNLSGSDKAPIDRSSYQLDDFWEAGERGDESFTGRPLNLEDGSADVHLARLRGWGYNMLRYVVTWEALEHTGPGQYDYEFMDYTVRVLRKCKEYGFKVYMDPHQDVWSRYSGGSGAPYWTLPACGLDPRAFTATQAAIVHCEYPSSTEPSPADLPAMIWSTNYGRLVSQTMFTLFFAGRDFAPKCIIDGQNIQDYLQSHYIRAFGELADRIRDAEDLLDTCVIGWDSMNEPFEGLCGHPDLNANPSEPTTMRKGTFPTPAQSMRLGMGQKQTMENWKFGQFGPQRSGSVTVDPQGVKVWANPSTEPDGVHPRWGWRRDPGWKLGTCIWAQHGVWDVESGYVNEPDYFVTTPANPERDVAFIDDYWRTHWQAYAERIRQSHPDAIMFVAPPVFAPPPIIEQGYLQGRCCYSAHYYDGLTLVTRHWNWFNADALGLLRKKYSSKYAAVKIGEGAIRKSIQEQLGVLKADAPILGPYPTIIGEIGIPYDMDSKRAYGFTDNGKYKGDYSSQQRALDASLNAADGPNALNYTIWNYCPDNSHEWGDQWNLEDLSLWSPDDLRPWDAACRMEMAGASSATLLKKGVQVTTASAATSALSLATLEGDDPSAPRSTANSFERWRKAFDFLTDGARAVKAFCRPFPSAIVGLPKDIEFNISKAEFKFTVLVRPEDAPNGKGISFADDEELATEIYIPLIHYASDSAIAQTRYRDEDTPTSSPTDEQGPLAKDSPAYTGASSSSSSTIIIGAQPASLAQDRLFSPSSTALALSVNATEGRWAVEGQTLKWWYPVPAPGMPNSEYTITITRAGGPLKTADELTATSLGMVDACLSCVGQSCCIQ